MKFTQQIRKEIIRIADEMSKEKDQEILRLKKELEKKNDIQNKEATGDS